MDHTLKQKIRQTGILLLLSALIPVLSAVIMRRPGIRMLLTVLIAAYYLICLYILVRTCTQIIWQLPYKKGYRLLLFAGWVILYPALSLFWASLLMICLAFGFQ